MICLAPCPILTPCSRLGRRSGKEPSFAFQRFPCMIVVTDRHGQLMQTNLSDLEERIGEIRHLDEQRAQIRDFIRRGKAALREALIGRRRSYANPRDLVEKSLVLHLFRDDPEAGQRLRFTELTETGPSLFFEALDREKGALGGTSDNGPCVAECRRSRHSFTQCRSFFFFGLNRSLLPDTIRAVQNNRTR